MTPLELQILDFVRFEIEQFGVSPTLPEIGAKLGIAKTTAHTHVSRLVKDGHLCRKGYRKRGLGLSDAVALVNVTTEQLRGELARRGETLDALATPRPLRAKGRSCAATCCGEMVEMGRLMCGRHWYGLPVALRDNVKRSFYARAQDAYRDYVREAIDLADKFGGVDRQVAA